MDIILAILLYLQVLVSPGTYSDTFIDARIMENQPRIDRVQNTQWEMDIVKRDYLPHVNEIIIVNESEM